MSCHEVRTPERLEPGLPVVGPAPRPGTRPARRDEALLARASGVDVERLEEEIVESARGRAFPVVCCACRGCNEPTFQRHRVTKLLRELDGASLLTPRGGEGVGRVLAGARGTGRSERG